VSGLPARLKFIGFFVSQNPDAASEAPSAKKRQAKDDRAVPETNDKGKGTSVQSCRRGTH
jgi:hypothetical protein